MRKNKSNQTIILNGESGSSKSLTKKNIVEYICENNNNNNKIK